MVRIPAHIETQFIAVERIDGFAFDDMFKMHAVHEGGLGLMELKLESTTAIEFGVSFRCWVWSRRVGWPKATVLEFELYLIDIEELQVIESCKGALALGGRSGGRFGQEVLVHEDRQVPALDGRSTEFHADLLVGPNLAFIDPNVFGEDPQFALVGLRVGWGVDFDLSAELALSHRGRVSKGPIESGFELDLGTFGVVDEDRALAFFLPGEALPAGIWTAVIFRIDHDRKRAKSPTGVGQLLAFLIEQDELILLDDQGGLALPGAFGEISLPPLGALSGGVVLVDPARRLDRFGGLDIRRYEQFVAHEAGQQRQEDLQVVL